MPVQPTGKGTYVIVYGERWILWTAHLAVFIALAKAVRARCIAKLCSLRQELRRILIVYKDDVVYTALV